MDDQEYRVALGVALRRLKVRALFEDEIRGYLSKYSQDSVENVIEFLKGRRIIDDTKTTQTLIERNSGKRSIGLEELRVKLLKRGAPEDTVNNLLSESRADESRRMFELISARLKPTDSRSKAARLLLSRGFPEEELEGVLDRFFGDS